MRSGRFAWARSAAEPFYAVWRENLVENGRARRFVARLNRQAD